MNEVMRSRGWDVYLFNKIVLSLRNMGTKGLIGVFRSKSLDQLCNCQMIQAVEPNTIKHWCPETVIVQKNLDVNPKTLMMWFQKVRL